MNWRRAAVLLMVAFSLRAAVVLIDHARPVFPSHHYADARRYHDDAVRFKNALPSVSLEKFTAGKRLYIAQTGVFYAILGDKPVYVRLANAAAASLAIVLWFSLFSMVLDDRTTLCAAGIIAFWPSHIFYSGQHLKEASVMLCLAAVFHAFIGESVRPVPRNAPLAVGSGFAFALGFYRPQLLPFIAAALLIPVFKRLYDREFRPALRLFLWLLIPVGAHVFLNGSGEKSPAAAAPLTAGNDSAGRVPTSFESIPATLGKLRRARLESSMNWSIDHENRKIETQIYPNAGLNDWGDFAAFLPKAVLTTLFMPLPGIASLNGKIGRKIAAAENTILLLIAVAALCGVFCFPSPTTGAVFAIFLATAIPAASFFEFDLGSAVRHKLHYLPFLAPLAARFARTLGSALKTR